jgi:hypothetical protein
VLARQGNLSLLSTIDERGLVEKLLDSLAKTSEGGGDGRHFADAVEDLVESDETWGGGHDGQPGPAVIAISPAGAALAVFVSGTAWAEIVTARGTDRLVAGQPGTVLRCVVAVPVHAVRGGLGTGRGAGDRTDRFSRLERGTVRAGGLSYHFGLPATPPPGGTAPEAMAAPRTRSLPRTGQPRIPGQPRIRQPTPAPPRSPRRKKPPESGNRLTQCRPQAARCGRASRDRARNGRTRDGRLRDGRTRDCGARGWGPSGGGARGGGACCTAASRSSPSRGGEGPSSRLRCCAGRRPIRRRRACPRSSRSSRGAAAPACRRAQGWHGRRCRRAHRARCVLQERPLRRPGSAFLPSLRSLEESPGLDPAARPAAAPGRTGSRRCLSLGAERRLRRRPEPDAGSVHSSGRGPPAFHHRRPGVAHPCPGSPGWLAGLPDRPRLGERYPHPAAGYAFRPGARAECPCPTPKREGVSVGLELVASPYHEGTLFRLAFGFEQATNRRRAPENCPELPRRLEAGLRPDVFELGGERPPLG